MFSFATRFVPHELNDNASTALRHAANSATAAAGDQHVHQHAGAGMEPRAYSNAPIGMNFFIAGYAYTDGDLSSGTLPIRNANIETSNAVAAYAHVFDLWGSRARST
ncbi:MAG: hypothetical protein IPI21_12435 [Propionivibrio sp.]|nr:hypothetical protein [Propionivibrio sp.]